MKVSQRVFELLPEHEIMTDGQTDGQTDRRTDKLISLGPPPTLSGGALMKTFIRPMSLSGIVSFKIIW